MTIRDSVLRAFRFEEVRTEVRMLKQELGKNGGYVFSSSKPIMRDVLVENAVALIEETIANEI